MGEMKDQVPYSQPSHSDLGAMADQARDVASDVADKAKGRLSTELAHRGEQSADQLIDVANALRQTSQQLHDNPIAPYIEKAAQKVDEVSGWVRNADVDQIKQSVEGFARREPLLFLGGAFVLGIAGARFLKSTSKGQP